MRQKSNRKTIPVTIEIFEDKWEEYGDMRSRLFFLVGIGQDVPAEIVERYFNCILNEQVWLKIENTYKYFSQISGRNTAYEFQYSVVKNNSGRKKNSSEADYDIEPIKRKKINSNQIEEVYSLRGVIEQAYLQLFNTRNKEILDVKKRCLRFLYNFVSDYIDLAFSGKRKEKRYAVFMKCVLSGYIAAQVGHLEGDETEQGFHKLLQQAMRPYSTSK